jgi:serine/threonine protein kinase
MVREHKLVLLSLQDYLAKCPRKDFRERMARGAIGQTTSHLQINNSNHLDTRAPEMLQKDENGRRMRYKCEVDWFSLGCMFHEFCTGMNPFKAEVGRVHGSTRGVPKEDVDARIDKMVLEYQPVPNSALFSSAGSEDFCLQLLAKNPSSRLGFNGALEVMSHPYFADLNWDDVINDTIQPPTLPRRDLNIGSQVRHYALNNSSLYHYLI